LPIQKGDILILASDTIGQFLLASFYILQVAEQHATSFQTIRNSPNRFAAHFQELENYYQKNTNETPQNVLSELKKALTTAEKFRNYTVALRDFGLLGIDDYSVIWVGF
jgi:hypothetical protein